MSEATIRLLLQIFAVAVGGSAVQLTIFLLKRRAELRSLDTTSDATALTAATGYVVALQTDIQALKEEMAARRKEWDAERATYTEALESANRELDRLLSGSSRLKADLMVARSQITELSSRLATGRHAHGGDEL
jgi:chromosome segregation ATPase